MLGELGELALQAFIQGLQPEQFREHIRLCVPKTLAEALREAERVLGTKRQSLCGRDRARQVHHNESDKEEAACKAMNMPPRRPRQNQELIPECHGGVLLVRRAIPFCMLLSGTSPEDPCSSATAKLGLGGTVEELPPVATPPSPVKSQLRHS